MGGKNDIVRRQSLGSSISFDLSAVQLPAPQLTLWPDDEAENTWAVRESRRARRLSVRVFRTGRVEVVVPRRTSQRAVARFVDQHRAWIERKCTEAQRNVIPEQPFPPQRIDLAACGESWRLHLAGGAGRVRVCTPGLGVLSVSGATTELHAMKQALRAWLTAKAEETLAMSLEATAREVGARYTKMAIRHQRSRWGSCSRRGTISLNASLLFQRTEVVRYLLIHELAHTRHMNHSKRFWQCVARWCPEYESLDRELREGWRRVPAWVSKSA